MMATEETVIYDRLDAENDLIQRDDKDKLVSKEEDEETIGRAKLAILDDELPYDPHSGGTTTIGIITKDAIILAGDMQVTSKGVILETDRKKVFPIGKSLACVRSGHTVLTYPIQNALQKECSQQDKEGKLYTIEYVAFLTSALTRLRKQYLENEDHTIQLEMALTLGGYDKGVPRLYCITESTRNFEIKSWFHFAGSGDKWAQEEFFSSPICSEQMSTEDAIILAMKSIQHAAKNDSHTGSDVYVGVIPKCGGEMGFFQHLDDYYVYRAKKSEEAALLARMNAVEVADKAMKQYQIEWQKHSELKNRLHNPFLEIREIEGRGKALFASQFLQAGQIILRDSPILLYGAVSLKNGDPSKFCSNCYRKLQLHDETAPSTVIECPNCSYHARFCSPICRSIALATSHTPWVCRALTCIRYSLCLSDQDAKIEANFLISAYNLAMVNPSSFRLLISLQGESPLTLDPQTLALHSFVASLSPSFAGFSRDLTAALLAKCKLNSFEIVDPILNSNERIIRAYGIYSRASFFNHSCYPNACRFQYFEVRGDDNTDIQIRALSDTLKGQEIRLNYVPVKCSYEERQMLLLDRYGFSCSCNRCLVESNSITMSDSDDDSDDGDDVVVEMYVCGKRNCGGTLAPLPPSPEGEKSRLFECSLCGFLKKEEEEEEEEEEVVAS